MQEIEVKILNINKEEIIQRLMALGAKQVSNKELVSIYFEKGNEELWHSGKMLRLRKSDKSILCFKYKKEISDVRSFEELEIEVSNFQNARQLLKVIGFSESKHVKQQRTSYLFKHSKIDIDKYESIPPLLEVESPTKAELREIVKLLGFTMQATTTMTGREVALHYGTFKQSAP
ncbi:MAG: class IV adenylate cyclase [Candidatus Woesearchaeota archaeon]